MGLSLTNVDVVYAGVIQVLRSVSIEVPDGSMVVLLGSNGAGKTTTLKAISEPAQGRARRGDSRLDHLRRRATSATRMPRPSFGGASSRCWRAERSSSI